MIKDMDTLGAAYRAWTAAARFRDSRDRSKRFTYGDQWSEIVSDHVGGHAREGDLLLSRGHRLLTNNLIRQLVKAIVGRYRDRCAEEGRYDTAPGSDAARNRLADLDARMLEEFVISGCAVQRVTVERRAAGSGVWVDNVDPRRFFVNRFTDPRGFDIELAGMLHDMSLPEVINRFGAGSAARARELQRLFDTAPGDSAFAPDSALGVATAAATPFFRAADGRCRVVEVWTLDAREAGGRGGRLHMEFVWRQRWLAPDGTLLYQARSGYGHGSHPFVVTMYPLTDGEIHSFVEDLIDQQRAINRLVTLIDTMIATSAKGSLLFPVRRVPRGMSMADIGKLWSAPDAVIPLDGQGEMPTQVVTNTSQSGAYQALSLQMRLLSDISGLSDAIMGRNVAASTGTEMYEAQVRNASVTLTDLLETFASFTAERDRKMAATGTQSVKIN